MKQTIYIGILLILLLACKKEPEYGQNIVNIDLNKSEQGKISDIYEDFEYILLDFEEDTPLVQPYKFTFTDNNIIVNDLSTNSLFFFEWNGKLENIIQPTGQGPREYFQLNNYHITKDSIYIIDTYLYKTLVLDKRGVVDKEYRNEFNNTGFYTNKKYNLYFLCHNPDIANYNFLRQDKSTGDIKGSVDIYDHLSGINKYRSYNEFITDMTKDEISFSIPYTTEIAFFQESTGDYLKTVYIDLGQHNLDKNNRKAGRAKLNEIVAKDNVVEDIPVFAPYKNGYFMFLKQGENDRHFTTLDTNFNIVQQIKNPENDIDGMDLLSPWTITKEHTVFLKSSISFYNNYVSNFSGKKVNIEENNIHRFFDKNKEKMKNELWVLILAKYKTDTQQ